MRDCAITRPFQIRLSILPRYLSMISRARKCAFSHPLFAHTTVAQVSKLVPHLCTYNSHCLSVSLEMYEEQGGRLAFRMDTRNHSISQCTSRHSFPGACTKLTERETLTPDKLCPIRGCGCVRLRVRLRPPVRVAVR